jgi:hypothetical protein
MLRRSKLVATLLVAGAAALVATLVLLRDGTRSYSPDEVSSAFARQGLELTESMASGQASALMPRDGSFTVLVLASDDEANHAFKPYDGDADPDTFEALAWNVIVLADGSNAATPLPRPTRARIMRALDELGRSADG